MNETGAGTSTSPNTNDLDKIKTLNKFLTEFSKYLVHQMSITSNGRIHADVVIENGRISEAGFHSETNIRIQDD